MLVKYSYAYEDVASEPGVYPATPQGWRTPPEKIYSPLEKDHQLPLRGSTCFDNQLTRPLHANLLLQHKKTGHSYY